MFVLLLKEVTNIYPSANGVIHFNVLTIMGSTGTSDF